MCCDNRVHNCNRKCVLVIASCLLDCTIESGRTNNLCFCGSRTRNVGRVFAYEFSVFTTRHREDTFENCEKYVLVYIVPIVCNFACNGQEVIATSDVVREVFFSKAFCSTNNNHTLRVGLTAI